MLWEYFLKALADGDFPVVPIKLGQPIVFIITRTPERTQLHARKCA